MTDSHPKQQPDNWLPGATEPVWAVIVDVDGATEYHETHHGLGFPILERLVHDVIPNLLIDAPREPRKLEIVVRREPA